jgi:hypothetical protein
MFAVTSIPTTSIRARPVARVSARTKSRAARVVTRAASGEGYVLFITSDKGEFVRAGSSVTLDAAVKETEPVRVKAVNVTEETAEDRAASAQAWIDAGLASGNSGASETAAASAEASAGASDADANAADAQRWIDNWKGASESAQKKWSPGKVLGKLFGRNPVDEKVVETLGQTDAEKKAIEKQYKANA